MAGLPRSQSRNARLRSQVAARREPCYRCRQPIDYGLPSGHPDSFTVEHIKPASTHPHLLYDPANCAASHKRCNESAGADENGRVIATHARRW